MNGSMEKKKGKDRGRRQMRMPALGSPKERVELALDIGSLVLGLLFSSTHALFGAYPLSVALISVLPGRVWYAVIGSVLGALTLGKSGLIYGMIYVVLAFLRIIASSPEAPRESTEGEKRRRILPAVPGGESIMLRVSVSVIGGFIASVYELLLGGFTETTLLFSVAMLLLPPIGVLLLAGLFDPALELTSVFGKGGDAVTALSRTGAYFKLSFLSLAFLLSLSMSPYSVLGVSFAYVLAGVLALWSAYALGPLAGGAVGFAAALGHSGSLSAAFALMGLAAGALFKLGGVFGIVGGGAAALLFCAYSGGLEGLLTVLPEYLIAAAIAAPLLRTSPKARAAETKGPAPDLSRTARDMVGTLSLLYRNSYRGSISELQTSLGRVGESLKRFHSDSSGLTLDEVRRLIEECIENYLPRGSAGVDAATLDALGGALMEKGRLPVQELERLPALAPYAESISRSVTRGLGILRRQHYNAAEGNTVAEDFELISKLVGRGRCADEEETAVNPERTRALEELLSSLGIADASCMVMGQRRQHILVAAPDPDGTLFEGRSLIGAIEDSMHLRLHLEDKQQRDGTSLLVLHALPKLVCRAATVGACCEKEQVSGDSALDFRTEDGRFYSVLCDGEGSGEQARASADFVTDFMRSALPIGDGAEATLGILNRIIRRRRKERSVTLDLFGADLYTGEAGFIKSGAASSYVKRGESIFRISSRTAPLGITAGLDAEHIRVGIGPESYIIMLSDGITVSTEDSGWFLELLAEEPCTELHAYASHILEVCLKHIALRDDCTVTVIKISSAEREGQEQTGEREARAAS